MKKQLLILLFVINGSAQVGVGTTTPQAAFHVESSNQGAILPIVFLRSAIDQTTVVSDLTTNAPPIEGTIIYNTNNVTGQSGVQGGLYVHTGTYWELMRSREHYQVNRQTRERTANNWLNFANIHGLERATIVPKFTGKYKITLKGRLHCYAIDTGIDADVWGKGRIELVIGSQVIASKEIWCESKPTRLKKQDFEISAILNFDQGVFSQITARFTPLDGDRNLLTFGVTECVMEIELKQ